MKSSTASVRERSSAKHIAVVLNAVIPDLLLLHRKTKSFRWHMIGPRFLDYHLLLDEQADHLRAMTDSIAERIRKVDGATLTSVGRTNRTRRALDNYAEYLEPLAMLTELREDNQLLVSRLRDAHDVCDQHRDIATASLIEMWIHEMERRSWFLFERGH